MAASSQPVGPVRDLEIVESAATTTFPNLPIINSSTRIPALDGLRGIAILLVLLHHSVFTLQPSSRLLSRLLFPGRLTWSGVDLFFVLSGFLIGGILFDARDSSRYFKTFYMRRAYRILPLYAAVVALFSLRFMPFHGTLGRFGNFSPSQIPWASYATFTQNIWMAFLGTFGATPMVVTWSLAVEEQFYLTVPFVIRKISRSHLVFALLAAVVAAPLLRTALYFSFPHGNFAAYVLMPCRADALSLGVLSALLVRTPRAWKLLLANRSALCWATGFLFLGLPVLAYRGYPVSGPMVTGGYSWLALFYTGCLLIVVTAASRAMQRVLCNRSLMQLGVIAYCTYLLHLPFIEGSRRILGLHFVYSSAATQLAGGLIGIVLTIAIATISWTFFEKPLLRRGHRYQY